MMIKTLDCLKDWWEKSHRLCSTVVYRSEESIFHLLSECTRLTHLRKKIWGVSALTPPYSVTPGQLYRFAKDCDLKALSDIIAGL